jgi:hypothetical protein
VVIVFTSGSEETGGNKSKTAKLATFARNIRYSPLRWQKYRLHQMYIAAAYGDPFVSDLVKVGRKSWAGIRNHLKRNSEHGRAMSDMLTQSFFRRDEKNCGDNGEGYALG